MLYLRDYQQQAVRAVLEQWKAVDSTLVVSPTGTGKTVLMCALVQAVFPGRTMILAHREELIFQARDKVRQYTGLQADVEMASLRADEHGGLFGRSTVVVSSIQTQNAGADGAGRMGRFDPMDFAVLIVDEAHHAVSPSYRRVLDYYRTNPALKVLGVTATPDRADEKALGQVFNSVAFDYEILDAIQAGYLVPIHQQMVEVAGLDYSGVRTTAGDLNGADLAAVMETEANLHGIASPLVEIAGDRKALVFTASVDHAERLAEILNRHAPGRAAWVCGKTPKDDRRRINADFAAGSLQYLCNVGTHTEGFDDPGIELLAMARPTKSRCLYAQMVGRGTRPLPGLVDGVPDSEARRAAIAGSRKPLVTVLDFVGNAGRHKLMTTADILGGKVSDDAISAAVLAARKTGAPVDMAKALEDAEKEVQERKAAEAAKRARLRIRAKFEARTVDPFAVLDLPRTGPARSDRGRRLSDKQADILRRQGIDPDGRPYHECKRVLDDLFRRWNSGLATFGQAKHLSRYGLPTDLPKSTASQVLDNIWKRRMSPEQALHAATAAADALAREVPF